KWRKLFPGNKVPLEQALEIARQIASALDYAHGQRIIHRDVKPSNVVVETKKGGGLAARVLDFGLAAEIRSSMGRVSREVRDTSGTRPYMAPEQWLGEKQGLASDQYALAVLVHELLTGEVPFASAFGTGDFELMKSAVTTIPFAAPEELPQPVRSALERALAKKSAERFASCGTFVAALEGEGTAAMPPGGTGRESPAPQRQPDASPPIDRPKPPSKKSKLVRRRILAILAGVGFLVFWGLWHTATRDREARLEEKVQLWEGGPYWASKNLGADKPEEYGLYFWWGDTEGHRPSGTTFDFNFSESNTPTYGKDISTLRSEGWIVSKNGTYVLAPEHDAAHVKWGGGWRMPTEQELTDLNGKCDWRWTTRNGVNGYVVRGRGAYVSNSIFLPAAGYGRGYSLDRAGSFGGYWSSVPRSDSSYGSRGLYFYSGGHLTYSSDRYYGFSVRPVQGFTK
ncbi:MAG: protein kinase, partial [Kiritimatiellae bacterium]|nr:protein kinase [Kiritimatiellia bacterium]